MNLAKNEATKSSLLFVKLRELVLEGESICFDIPGQIISIIIIADFD